MRLFLIPLLAVLAAGFAGSAAAQSGNVTVDVTFPGLTSAHVYLHSTNGASGTATGSQVASATWKNDSAQLSVAPGIFDVRVVQGPATIVIDDVDCQSGPCTVPVPLATLTVDFPGLTSAHAYAHLPDGASGSYGQQVASKTWQNNAASMVVVQGIYDIRVVHGPATAVIDDIDCQSETCSASVDLATLTVDFPGLTSAHAYAHLPDGAAGSYGQQVASKTWQNNTASMVILQGVYDIRMVQGPATLVIDDVDCRAATCTASVPLATLTADFPGLTSAHAYAHLTDGAAATYGLQVASKTWQNNVASMVVLQAVYDVRMVQGPMTLVIDNVDCRAATCAASVPLATLTVNFPGLTSAHIYAQMTDGLAGSYGAQVSGKTWQNNNASMVLLQGVFDVRAVQGPVTSVIDNVDCRASTCTATVPLAALNVQFPGRTNIHTYVRVNDTVTGTATGTQVVSATWQTNSTAFVILRGLYDVVLREGSVDQVIDAVDCTEANCVAAVSLGLAVPTATPTETPTATPTSTPTDTAIPTATPTPLPAAAVTPGIITFLGAQCPNDSQMAVDVTGGRDPSSGSRNGPTAEVQDIASFGCEAATPAYQLYLLGGSSSNVVFLDAGLTNAAVKNSNDTAWDGSATRFDIGQSVYVTPGSSAARRFSVAGIDHPGSAWPGLPFLDLHCYTDGVNNDNADGVGWDGQALAPGEQAYCILYYAAAAVETPTPDATATAEGTPTSESTPEPTPTASSEDTPGDEESADRERGIRKELVSARDGLATWRISPLSAADLYVWDDAAVSCDAFGGATCGGIGGDKQTPGTFVATSTDQHLIVTQEYEERENTCEVDNTAEWSTDPDGSPRAEGGRVNASYQCSGATVLGWPLLFVLFVLASSAMWAVRRRMA